MSYPYSEAEYPYERHYEDELMQGTRDSGHIEEYDMQHFNCCNDFSPSPSPRTYVAQHGNERDYLDEDDDITAFEKQTQPDTLHDLHFSQRPFCTNTQSNNYQPQRLSRGFENTIPAHEAYMNPSQPQYPRRPFPAPTQPSQLSPTERGSNPRNSHGIPLKPTSTLPDMYRSFFKFGVFNAIQSRCYDTIMNSTDNMVISAPTGSGKTVLFELALIRLLMKQDAPDIKCVYMAPTKALCSERYRDWTTKLEPIGIKCCELTGDTVAFGRNAWGDAKNSSVIITTPEKFDSLSRNWRDHGDILSRTQLFLIDEVHILNESRGSTLEVVSSRMRSRGTSVRFMLVSATVPNINDVATWIGNGPSEGPAMVFNFGDEFRPCKLTRVVYGYPRKNQNDFSFSRTLDYKLLPLLQQHAVNKPVLIFCATRKGVVGAAEVLMKEYQKLTESKQSVPWTQPRRIDAVFHDHQLQEFAAAGLGVHHAGLTLDDRRVTEDLFLRKIIRVVVATSTLAVGVNLPAHTVVIKGVKMWMNGGWQEYSDIDFIQMIGRAGRPQFDKEGVAIILCDNEQERKYKTLVAGKTLLESCLHVNLSEHLNSEIGVGTITDLNTAKEWLHNSFLFQRIQKNPRHYALDKASDQTWQSRLDELVESSVRDLQRNELVTDDGRGGNFASTEYGEIMSKYYIRLSTMGQILKLSGKSNLREILELISSAEEIDIRLRAGDKQVYKKIGDHNDIRFRTKIEKASDKIFLLAQAALGGVSLNSPEYKTQDSQPFLEALTVFKHAPRIARAIVEVAIAKRSGAVLMHGMELVRSLTAKTWEDRPTVLRQVEQIGEKSIKVLAQNGITTLAALRRETPGRIELLLNRRPPFGNTVLTAARELPQFSLSITEVSVSSSNGKKPVVVELEIECGLVDVSDSQPTSTKTRKFKTASLGMTGVLTLTSDNDFVDFRRIPTKALRTPKSFLITAGLTKPSQTVLTRISPDNFAGLTLVSTYKPQIDPKEYPTLDTRPASYDVDAVLAGLEDDPTFWELATEDPSSEHTKLQDVPLQTSPKPRDRLQVKSTSKTLVSLDNQLKTSREPGKLPNGNYQCLHACKDKANCRHLCCRDGLAKPPKKNFRPELPDVVQISEANFVHMIPSVDTTRGKQKSKTRYVPNGGLKHLETLHKKSGGLEFPAGRRLKLDSAHLSSTRKPEKVPWNMDLTFTDMSPSLKPQDQEADDLPDPHEVLQEGSNLSAGKPSDKSHYSDPDLDSFMADVPLALLNAGDAFPSHKQGYAGPTSGQSVIKADGSSILPTPRRRRRSMESTSPSPSPVKKRPRLDSRLGTQTVNNSMETTAKSSKSSKSKASTLSLHNPKNPLARKVKFPEIARPQDTVGKGVPLFLASAFNSDEQSQEVDAPIEEDHDEPFIFDPHTFHVEPTTPSLAPVAPRERIKHPIVSFTEETASGRFGVSVVKVHDPVDGVSQMQEEGNGATTSDDYEQGLIEYEAWYQSGAVEITDGP